MTSSESSDTSSSNAVAVNARAMRRALKRLRRNRMVLAVLTVLLLGDLVVGLSSIPLRLKWGALLVGGALAVGWMLAAQALNREADLVDRLLDTDGGAHEYERQHAGEGDRR